MSTNLLRSAALALGLAALAAPAAHAQDLYVASYQGGVSGASDQETFVLQSLSMLNDRIGEQIAEGNRPTNLEAYHDETGSVVYAATFAPGSGSVALVPDVPGGAIQGVVNQQASNNNRGLALMTSVLDGDTGERLYTLIFRGGASAVLGQQVAVNVPKGAFELVVTDQQALGFEITALVAHRDPGSRRFTAVFTPNVLGNSTTLWDIDEAQFLSENVSQTGAGRPLTWFEGYRNDAGDVLYAARWSNGSPGSGLPVVSIAPDLTAFIADYVTNTGFGRMLIDLEVFEQATVADTIAYGTGLAGLLGEPTLALDDEPYLGRDVTLELGSSSPVTALAGLFVGVAPASLPFKGGTLLVAPLLDPILLSLPPGGLGLPATMPSDPLLDGLSVYLQLAVQDLSAPNGIALSEGLELLIGQLD